MENFTKKILLQVLLYIVMLVLTINTLMSNILLIGWFIYVALGLVVGLLVVMVIFGKAKEDKVYMSNPKLDRVNQILLMVFLGLYLGSMLLSKGLEDGEQLSAFFSANYFLLQWIMVSFMLAISIAGVVMKVIEYKGAQSND